jgi:hypothetical protein
MDLRLYARVLWRFRKLMALGFVLAVALTFLTVVRVGFAHGSLALSYRQHQKWVSYATLFVTQQGFPWGRATLDTAPPTPTVRPQSGQSFADPGRFSSLAMLYSQLATSDQVVAIIKKSGPLNGEIQAAPILSDTVYQDALPLVSLAGIAYSQRGAVDLARRATSAFETFLEQEQRLNEIPASSRVIMTVIQDPRKAKLLKRRSVTLPAVVFLSVMILFSGIAFILENMRPRVRALADTEAAPDAVPSVANAARRTA